MSRLHVHRLGAGVTLIEILTVLGIVAVLAGLLFVVYAHAREAARQRVCVNNWTLP